MPDTDEVRDAFDGVSSAEFETSDITDGIRVTVSDEDAGQLFKTIRTNGFDAQTKRLGDILVSRIDAEKSEGLGDLFG